MINERNILGIDEFENGLHFDKQKQVAESLLNASKQFDTQLFVTSHSQECSVRFLNAVEEAGQADDFSCFYLDRDDEGEIVARQRDFESAKFILENWKDDEDHRFV
jgi:AAA15 family ATPase/GTPase